MPQLTYVPAEAPLIELGTLADGVAVVAEPIEVAGGVAWRPALNAALTLAVPTAAICFLMATLGEALARISHHSLPTVITRHFLARPSRCSHHFPSSVWF